MSDDILQWQTSTGKHNLTKYTISHPPGWEIRDLPTTSIITSPKEPNALVSLMWFTGTGNMNLTTILNNTIQYNGIQDYQILQSSPVQILNTPVAPSLWMEQEALFTYRGERCRLHANVQFTDANPPYMLFWSASIVWSQAPAVKWDKYRITLKEIASSFRIVSGNS